MGMTLLEQRAVEANIFQAIYGSLSETLGPKAALEAVQAAARSLAAQAGRAFAACAPPEQGPNFEHFKTVLELWQGTGALHVENVRDLPGELSFTVVRCAYVDKYREMGLPEELAGSISCCRDEPFATGYSEHIVMERPETIGDGGKSCRFRFRWKD